MDINYHSAVAIIALLLIVFAACAMTNTKFYDARTDTIICSVISFSLLLVTSLFIYCGWNPILKGGAFWHIAWVLLPGAITLACASLIVLVSFLCFKENKCLDGYEAPKE